MSFVIPAPPTASIEIAGTEDRFPVRRIYCIGRNYQAHRREMGSDDRKPSFFFRNRLMRYYPPVASFLILLSRIMCTTKLNLS
jgi:2-keto-4-pentenoate hydratase/2-oxohepta-3-ene-1,7-dioic acid hydratase in catechol pathway